MLTHLTHLVIGLTLIASSSSAAHAKARDKVDSVYTNLTGCKVLEQSTEEDDIDFFTEECPGIAGFKVHHVGGDARSFIEISRENEPASDLLWIQTMNAAQLFFPAVSGSKLEWRGTVKRGKFVPFAFIYRIAGQTPEDELKTVERLIVGKIGEKDICIFGSVQATGNPNGNVQAREMAEAARAAESCPQ